MASVVELDPWAKFRLSTRARIGLGRSGDAMPTDALLDFQLAHAQARDAVHGRVDFEALAAGLPDEHPVITVTSAAADRITYLRRPDLGRRLSEASHAALTAGDWDAAFVIADGLSAAAVTDHAVPTVTACLERLSGWKIAPIVLAQQARVAIGDDIAARLGARLVVVLIGERPGLSVANSLGMYLTWAPKVGRKDSERNCISNVHADGLSYTDAAAKAVWLMTEARRRQLTGIDLKEEAADALTSTEHLKLNG